MYDPATVRALTVDELGVSNGIVSALGAILIHKLTLEHADGSAALSVLLRDGTSNGATAVLGLSTTQDGAAGTFSRYAEANYAPPVRFEVGLTTDITGTGTCRIFYTPT